jgi:hypothetical protein
VLAVRDSDAGVEVAALRRRAVDAGIEAVVGRGPVVGAVDVDVEVVGFGASAVRDRERQQLHARYDANALANMLCGDVALY